MNAVWWMAVGFGVLFAISAIAFFIVDESSAGFSAICAIGVVAFLLMMILYIVGDIVNDHQIKQSQKRQLQSVGFTYVNVDGKDKMIASLPMYPRGCRIRLEKDGNFWLLTLPKDQTRSIDSATSISKWPSIIEWCGTPQRQ